VSLSSWGVEFSYSFEIFEKLLPENRIVFGSSFLFYGIFLLSSPEDEFNRVEGLSALGFNVELLNNEGDKPLLVNREDALVDIFSLGCWV